MNALQEIFLFVLERVGSPLTLVGMPAGLSRRLNQLRLLPSRVAWLARKRRPYASSTESMEEVSLKEIVASVVQAQRAELEQATRVDVMASSREAYRIRGHSQQLEVAIGVLVSNARDAISERFGGEGPTKGHLEITLKDKQDRIVLSVADNGCGMRRETLIKIFDPRFSTKPAKERKDPGLSECRSIVSRHGAKIDIGTEPGRGTTVTIEWPTRT